MAPLSIALACFANMFSVGTIYALSALQGQLPRLLGISDAWSFVPFGMACMGLSVGVATCASMIAQHGAHATAASGTALWGLAVIGVGFFLSRVNFEPMLLCLLFGGLGVGWTYLAVVVMVGQGFPDLALARSAIGPMGFSSGAATCFFLSSVFELSTVDAESLGRALTLAGAAFVAVGGATQLMMIPGYTNNDQSNSPKKTPLSRPERLFSILLFFNALPGMTAFAALLPLVSYYASERKGDPMTLLSHSMLALASGGVLAPTINLHLGARNAFVVLFCLRGALLVLLSQFERSTLGLCAFLTILFAHGTGFSILPGLVKAKGTPPELFPRSYGRVLVTWGVAGILGCVLNTAISSSIGTMSVASLVLGLLTLSFGIILHFVPTLGAGILA
ncbi:Major facilitator superfamily domain general substrate transporter [Penicillium samsonianum]|uniref:Major facilitator superfamily domain general substrate transporter n=1 Tax=Penicillium samsonianum TaxID=1882272 RepID=UPI002546D65B|nr:Major facilitator superfamily domain general substrate transporter [Penicillium samsonianum]KAJ6123912.1 Major facilitator superfamily domain general substrate transporter [Penicillium samsonianum]